MDSEFHPTDELVNTKKPNRNQRQYPMVRLKSRSPEGLTLENLELE